MNNLDKLKDAGRYFQYIGYSLLMHVVGIAIYFLINYTAKLSPEEIQALSMTSAAYHLIFIVVIIINFIDVGIFFSNLKFYENALTKNGDIQLSEKRINQNSIKPCELFELNVYPFLTNEISLIKNSIADEDKILVPEIIISYCKNHSISKDLNNANPNLSRKIINGNLNLDLIERLFEVNKGNNKFMEGFEAFLKLNLR